jgi:hypothetical protein
MCSRSALLVLLVLLVGGCSDMTFFRAKADYFPLVRGSRWTFQGGATTVDSVAGDSSVLGRACVVVLTDYAPGYWIKTPTEVRKYDRLTTIRSGYEYLLEERFGLRYVLPLVKGSTWEEVFHDTIVLMGTDSVFLKDSVGASVSAIEDVDTPGGTFLQCYRIEYNRVIHGLTDSVEATTEWLAPDVGVVKRRTAAGEQVLTGYQPGR